MMFLSRVWYAIVAILAGVGLYALMLAVGQYNRQSAASANEAVAADSKVVKWALVIDARRRLDAMLLASVDKGIQDALGACADKDKIPSKAREDAKKALSAVAAKMPADYQNDAMFVVDRDGRVVAQVGYERASAFEDFELGGYAAVNDALHGFLRDDTWVWGDTLYRVVTRPVEVDSTQAPAGAVVGIRAIDKKFVQDLNSQTHASVAFYAAGKRVASIAEQGFDETRFDVVEAEVPKLDGDATYKEKGRTDVRSLGDGSIGGVFTRIDGEAYALGAGFAVLRARPTLPGPQAFLQRADDKDKAGVNLPLVGGFVAIAFLIGIVLTFVEHDRPLSRMKKEAIRLKKGDIDLFHLPVLPGAYRAIGTDINAGIERVAEKGGGAPRKAADLEAILGPVPAQPAMSAFSFPDANAAAAPVVPKPPPPAPTAAAAPVPAAPPAIAAGAPPVPAPQKPPPPKPAPVVALAPTDDNDDMTDIAPIGGPPPRATKADEADWPNVFADFVRVKKECNEPTEGLTFDKFQVTLRKNRDTLVSKHGCKTVKFTVYVKEGRASLKATPIKD